MSPTFASPTSAADGSLRQSDRPVRVGVVGCGYWGPKLARNFDEIPESELVVVADQRPDRLADILARYPQLHTTCDYAELLSSDIDAVVIATPVHTHYALAKAALLADKHVLIEKPITARSDHAVELINIAEERGLILMVGHTFEYNPAVRAVRAVIDSGELGQIYYINATRANLGLLQPDINVIWDLGPHDISILRYLLGEDPLRVGATGGVYVNKARGLHEVAYLALSFPSGILVNMRLSWLDPVKQRSLTVVGSKKMLVYDDIADDKVVIYDKGVDVAPYSITEQEFRASYRHGSETIYPVEWVEPLRYECSHFIECITTGATPQSDGRNGLAVLRVLETAQRSLMNGGVELLVEY